ncbi:hypothetical protein [Streptomyces sp. NPDC088739]|uniref:hypothetical protein n=1 Tax=Streptomyces sp. NPDC088739 TaxID=3365882 RepID=UPI003808A967
MERPRVLLSYWYARRMDWDRLLDVIAGWDVILDSGAFSAHTQGGTVDLDAYARWLRLWSGRAVAAFSLDVIDDPVASARNYRRLLDADTGMTIIPVHHAGTHVRFLDDLLNSGVTYVGFGGMVEHYKRRNAVTRWVAWHLRHCADAGARVHGLGYTASAVNRLPLYSVDSSTWVNAERRGFLCLWDDRRNMITQIQIRNPEAVARCAPLMRRVGIDPARVSASGFLRGEQLHEDRSFCHETAISGYQAMDVHLRERHQVSAPASIAPADAGTKVYVAATSFEDLSYVTGAWARREVSA